MRGKISKMSFLMRISSLLCLVLFYGCGVSSLYGPAYYDETNLGEGLMRVTFKGGEHPTTGELCLLRCAEVCLESGYSHFEVVDSETGSSLQNSPSTYPFNGHYFHDDPFIHDMPFSAKTIRMHKNLPEGEFAYDAREISISLKRKYEIK